MGSFRGLVERENLIEGLKREVFEESGILCEPVKMVGIYQIAVNRKGYGPLEGETLPPVLAVSFICDYTGGKETTHLTRAWKSDGFDKDEVLEMITKPIFRKRAEDVLNYDPEGCTSAHTEMEPMTLKAVILL